MKEQFKKALFAEIRAKFKQADGKEVTDSLLESVFLEYADHMSFEGEEESSIKDEIDDVFECYAIGIENKIIIDSAINGGLLNRGLPKWPQMIVTGEPVSAEYAKEIIARTDSFFSSHGEWAGGNMREYNEFAQRTLGIQDKNAEELKDYPVMREAHDNWKEKWGYIDTNYVKNSWLSCNFIFGAHGWMHPDGNIGFVDNVGKYPGIEDIYCDWVRIAREFKDLSIDVTLMSGESCEEDCEPVVSMMIRDGIVLLIDPHEKELHKGHTIKHRSDDDFTKAMSKVAGERSPELGLVDEVVFIKYRNRAVEKDCISETDALLACPEEMLTKSEVMTVRQLKLIAERDAESPTSHSCPVVAIDINK